MEQYRSALRTEMEAVLPPLPLLGLARYHLGWVDEQWRPALAEGKLLRPRLLLAACQAVGTDPERALPAAAAVELVHNFSLVHDDVEDESHLRHHRSTVWHRWGTAQAINTGDALFAAAHLALLRLLGRGVDAGTTLRASRALGSACLQLCHGQFLDLDYESRPKVGPNQYREMVRGKTAALMEACLYIGGLVGGANRPTLLRLRRTGRHLGLAFQIQDDVLDLWVDEGVTGKMATDMLRKKKTFPLVLALSKTRGKARREIDGLLSQQAMDARDVQHMATLLEQLGLRQRSLQVAQGYFRAASAEMHACGFTHGNSDDLQQMMRLMGERSF
jgi:geranylgeranyl diphosphate synthase type I